MFCKYFLIASLIGSVANNLSTPLNIITVPIETFHNSWTKENDKTFETKDESTTLTFQKETSRGFSIIIGGLATATNQSISPSLTDQFCTEKTTTWHIGAFSYRTQPYLKCKPVSDNFIINAAQEAGYTGEVTIKDIKGYSTTHSIISPALAP